MSLAIVIAGACAPQAIGGPSPTAAAPPTLTRASASLTALPTAARPSPTPAPSAAAACRAIDGGVAGAAGDLTAIRIAHQVGADRLVFEFAGSAVPAYQALPAGSFVGISGRPVPVQGNAFIRFTFQNASTQATYAGATDLRPSTTLIKDVRLVDDFERVMVWGVGLEREECAWRLSELAAPARLVVDLPSPP